MDDSEIYYRDRVSLSLRVFAGRASRLISTA